MGFIFLMIIVIGIQCFLFFGKYKLQTQDNLLDNAISLNIQKELDSLERLAHQPKKIYPFNPNYFSDYKAYQLGLSVKEIDRLLLYRSQGKYINSAKEFQKVTKVSDSLLLIIAPYFKFPKWTQQSVTKKKQSLNDLPKTILVKDINKATKQDLLEVYGIGDKRAETILNYRKILGGFSTERQFDEVWGLTPEVLQNLKKHFQVLSKPEIIQINVNTATVNQLKSIVYINFKQAKSIVEYRKEVAEIQNLAELKTISNFPVDKYDLISLYLHAQ